MFRAKPTTIDLTNDAEPTFALLLDATWKTRGVEEITIGSALAVESRRSYQCADLRRVIGDWCSPGTAHATLLLPVTTYPKRPLLGFDVSAPDRATAYLPPRGALAELEARLVLDLAASAGITVSPRLAALTVAICEFTPGKWHELWLRRWRLPPRNEISALRTYFALEAGWDVSCEQIKAWQAIVEVPRTILNRAGALNGARDNSAVNPLLVLPLLRSSASLSPARVSLLLTEYASFVSRCDAATFSQPLAPHALLADYGERWDAMVECTVPLDGPFILRVGERRPLKIRRLGRVDLDVTTGDARSNHVVVRVTDENVWIRSHRKLVPKAPGHRPAFDGERRTREEVALYTAEPEREYGLLLRLRLATARDVLVVYTAIVILTVLSLALIWVRRDTMSAADLAVVVIPTSFAASLAVTRERTTLATRLQRGPRFTLLLLTLVLWTLVGMLYISDTQISEPSPAPPCDRICHTPGVRSGTRDGAPATRSHHGQEHR